MHRLLSILTAALLFIHTVFGCCWHHAHHGEHDQSSATSGSTLCCHHAEHSGDSEPCERHVECEGACIYVLPQKVAVEAPQELAVDLPVVLPSLACQQVESARTWEAGRFLHGSMPPLRIHLLHQVLLN